MSDYRWTVRRVDPQAIQALHEVKAVNPGTTLGQLLSEAIQDWYDNLEEQTDEEPDKLSDC
jgi:hypothetical protein